MTSIDKNAARRTLGDAYRAAAKAWEDRFRATGKWDAKLERAMTKAHRAYLASLEDDNDEQENK